MAPSTDVGAGGSSFSTTGTAMTSIDSTSGAGGSVPNGTGGAANGNLAAGIEASQMDTRNDIAETDAAVIDANEETIDTTDTQQSLTDGVNDTADAQATNDATTDSNDGGSPLLMKWHGGKILATNTTYAIYWGANGLIQSLPAIKLRAWMHFSMGFPIAGTLPF